MSKTQETIIGYHAKAHSRLAMSAAPRWFACPGSPRECAAFPHPQEDSDDAVEGTKGHRIGERALVVGTSVEEAAAALALDVKPETLASVAVYVEYIRQRYAATRIECPDAILAVEKHCDNTWLHPDLWGTADAAIFVKGGHCEITDYKNGRHPVEVKDNPQLIGYALYPLRHYDAASVTVTIVQPNAEHADGPIRSHTYTRDELTAWAQKFRAAAMAADAPDAPLVPGEHCHFCPAAGTCPALRKHALTVAGTTAAEMSVPPAPNTLTPVQLRQVLDAAKMVAAWVKAVQSYALNEARAGRVPDGYKVVEGRRGNRKWTNEDEAAATLGREGVQPFEQYIISPANAEKELRKRGKRLPAELVTQSPGEPTLAPESDPRPALVSDSVSDFPLIPNNSAAE
jgi:hypothetical protein